MRKLFMFLAVAGLATFGTACSSSDDSNPVKPGETATLVVSTSKATAEVGEKVTITVKEGTTDVTDKANILVNGTKISGNELTSDIAGEFKVTATKDGAKDAAAVVVKFVAKGTVLKKLVLTATPSTIELNAETVFKVTLDNVDVTTTSTIKVDGVAVTGGKYKGTVAGTYTAVASQAGAEDSATITIIVKPADVPTPESNFIAVGNTVTKLKEAGLFYFANADGSIYKVETQDGKTYIPFSVRAFNNEIVNGRVEAVYYENSGLLLVYVEQVSATTLNDPYTATADQIEIVGYNGSIDSVDFEADEETLYGGPIFVAPATEEGKGSVRFAVEGNTMDGAELLTDFEGPLTAYFKITLPPATVRTFSNLSSAKKATGKFNVTTAKAVRVNSIR